MSMNKNDKDVHDQENNEIKKEHTFWQTQPVEVGDDNCVIEKKCEIVEKSIVLPKYFKFSTLDVKNELHAVYEFLKENYVEDGHSKFRLLYSKEHLLWQLLSPGFKNEYAVTIKYKNIIKGLIFATEKNIKINGKEQKMAIVNFLCLDKQLRNKRLSPVMISEIRRRINYNNIISAIFTAGQDLPFKLTQVKYYHYLIDIHFLNKIGFCDETFLSLKYNLSIGLNTRELKEEDFDQVKILYDRDMKNKKIYEIMDQEMFRYNFLKKKNVVYSYVKEEGGKVISFGSFYILSTTAIETNQEIPCAYLYMINGDKKYEMVKSLIELSKIEGCKMFNTTDIFFNEEELLELGFCKGDGKLNYYLFNYKASPINPNEVYYTIP
ncbi:N-myristoyltransferase [Spraguea lophii 42_110]|uniref:Glycylpeptide N-tetradecanoyltransferase n=1 Tax=Spraguea lophii (strain 42_110) TaxID=1358809 RepID=S7WCL4_SPRLO|nr:N-myristoyltransferase [Spraguea lophii 42_110]